MDYLNNMQFKKESRQETGSGLLDGMYKATSMGRTENYALTFTRSGSALVDFYAQAGAMRDNPELALELFQKAFAEDRQSAVRILFYIRDVRGGQGERDIFRICLSWLGDTFIDVFESIVNHVPEYGRWDDMFFDNEKCFDAIRDQLSEDKKSDTPTLLAKWLPTINASSPTTRAKARFMAKRLGMHDLEYRKTLRSIRKQIKAVEEQMSANDWENINYSSVPSQAARIYRNAFGRHDEQRYNDFIEKATSGEEEIKAATLYPYQIYDSVRSDYSPTLEALWNQLPDYTDGRNGIVVADVSGSMHGRPMSVSVSLALYFAERNTGNFKDHFITFSGNPTLQRVVGETLREKMYGIENADWEMNTDIQAVFDLILQTGIEKSVPQEEMPSTIYIVSDMEFDECAESNTNFELIQEKYQASGYEMPTMVFWNVDARSGRNLPVQKDESGVAMVSGFSPVIFKMAVENKSPEQLMLDTVNSERYSKITLTQ